MSSGKDTGSKKIAKTKRAKVIDGEDAVFAALAKAIRAAEKSVYTTRLSPHNIDRSKKYYGEFDGALRDAVGKSFEDMIRIVTANHSEKKEGVNVLIMLAEGKATFYLIKDSQCNYDYELVVIDDKKAFSLYRESDTPPDSLCSYAIYCENKSFINERKQLFAIAT